MNGKYYVGARADAFERYNPENPVTGVALCVDDRNAYYAGDQDGNVWTLECPYATQEMANNILATLQNRSYIGYRATNATLDPRAELGDGITVGGLYSVLAYRKVTFGAGHLSEIKAPGNDEPEDEYKRYISPEISGTKRKFAQTYSFISKTAEEIRLEVSATYSTKTELSDGLKESEESFTAKIEETARDIDASVSGEISEKYTELDGKITNTETTLRGEIKVSADEITSSVEKQIKQTTKELDGKISSATETLTTKIEQTDKDIRFDVSQEYVTTETLNGDFIESVRNEYNAAISLSETGIKNYVSATYTTKNEFGETTKSLRSSIEQNAGSIKTTIERVDALGTSYSSIEQTVDSITTRINDFNGKGSSIEETVDSITTNVSGLGGKYTKLEQTVEGFTFEDDEGKVWINNGNINLTGTISWEDLTSKVQGEINNRGISNSEAKTLINSTLVSSPNIAGGKFYALGAHTGELGDTWLEIGQDGSGWGGMILKDKDYYGENYEVFSIFNGDFMAGSMSWKGETFLTWNDTTGYTVPTSTWDFSNATVIWGTNAPYAVFQ